MRNIRNIRAKSVKTNTWVYGTGLTDFRNMYPDIEALCIWSDYEWKEIIPETVGHCIGMSVDNHNIYEGDILKHKTEGLIPWVVCFEQGCYGIKNNGMGEFSRIDSPDFFVDRYIVGNTTDDWRML